MKLQFIALTAMVSILVACGTERPNPDDYIKQGSTETATAGNKSAATTKTADAAKKDTTTAQTPPAAATTPPVATPPAATPPAAKAPIRALVNATEIATARTAYGTDCASCHQPLATSAKKGRTRAQIEAAVTVAAHVNTAGLVAKWPKDVIDKDDDGVDTAVFKGSAMAEALK